MTKGKICKICKRYVPWGKRGMASHLKKKHKKTKKRGGLTKRQRAARKRYPGSGLQRLNMKRKAKAAKKTGKRTYKRRGLTKRQLAARKAWRTRKRKARSEAAKARYQGSGLQRHNMAKKAAKAAKHPMSNVPIGMSFDPGAPLMEGWDPETGFRHSEIPSEPEIPFEGAFGD